MYIFYYPSTFFSDAQRDCVARFVTLIVVMLITHLDPLFMLYRRGKKSSFLHEYLIEIEDLNEKRLHVNQGSDI